MGGPPPAFSGPPGGGAASSFPGPPPGMMHMGGPGPGPGGGPPPGMMGGPPPGSFPGQVSQRYSTISQCFSDHCERASPPDAHVACMHSSPPMQMMPPPMMGMPPGMPPGGMPMQGPPFGGGFPGGPPSQPGESSALYESMVLVGSLAAPPVSRTLFFAQAWACTPHQA